MPRSKSKRSRYTPPPPKKAPPSPLWVPVAMGTLLLTGLVVLLLNFVGVLPGDDFQNRYLLLGLGLVVGGFLLATGYR